MAGRGAAAAMMLGIVASFDQPAGLLNDGTRLYYQSSGQRTIWIVDSVRAGESPTCRRVWLRIGDRAEVRHDCVRDGALYRFDARHGQWREERPITPHDERRYARAGGTVTFSTGVLRTDTIGARLVQTIETTMLMLDSSGAPVRRLRERFAVGLMTATWGRFETPVPGGGWRTQQEFTLRAIE